MSQVSQCPECGANVEAGTAGQPCPGCLMKLGLESWTHRNAGRDDAGRLSPTTPLQHGFTAPSPDELAARFPQLELLELIGQGGMGAVYKARQTALDRIVALKILPTEFANDPGFAERFTREAKSLARLNHPNIVTVYDFGRAGDLYYFVMEYVEGSNLRHVMQSGQVSTTQALGIVPQICEALQFAHDASIVHRDIKPENILITPAGRVKIADFGLAKLLGLVPNTERLTATQQVMGTPQYMAPEQFERPQSVDHRTDIYSLGVVFYEMLTGELPLGRFAAPSKKVQIDVRLDDVVLRALEKEPERRYQQAGHVKTEIDTIRASVAAGGRILLARFAAGDATFGQCSDDSVVGNFDGCLWTFNGHRSCIRRDRRPFRNWRSKSVLGFHWRRVWMFFRWRRRSGRNMELVSAARRCR